MLTRLLNGPKTHVSYKGDPFPDDIVRVILKHAAQEGMAARAVCKGWLRVSNSLVPFFLNCMKALKEQIITRATSPSNCVTSRTAATWNTTTSTSPI